jgi:hypothetical protein
MPLKTTKHPTLQQGLANDMAILMTVRAAFEHTHPSIEKPHNIMLKPSTLATDNPSVMQCLSAKRRPIPCASRQSPIMTVSDALR